MKKRFVNLHVHTENSALDGAIRIKEGIEKVKRDGGTALAITDHGNMVGAFEFHNACRKADINPIIGVEVYTSDMAGGLNQHHMVLIAKNEIGYKNLLKLVSGSHKNFYKKPHVLLSSLKEYSEGVIATSACLGGLIPRLILANKQEEAKEMAKFFQGIYGDDFYLEIQRHSLSEEAVVNPILVDMGKELGIKLIATADAHYLNREDAKAHEVLLCIGTKKSMEDPTHFTFRGEGYHLATADEMNILFQDIPEAVENTVELANKCNVVLSKVSEPYMPHFEIPETFSDEHEYFVHLCKQGFENRFGGSELYTSKEYTDRLEYELSIITKMRYEGYFLVVQDYINFARSQNIFVGPGRGSACGSLVAYCLGITDMDPIEFKLLFERFLNPDRISMPDIDTDFEHTRRDEVQEYIRQKYGKENVSGIATYGTLAARIVCKDVAKALGYDVATGVRIAKCIPEMPNMTIDKALDMNPEFSKMVSSDQEIAEIISIAKKLEGLKRHTSQHACGLIISPQAVSDFIPTALIKGELCTQHTMAECEDEGLLKMDLLGLKNLTVIHDVIDAVVEEQGKNKILQKIGSQNETVRYYDIPLNDRATYQMLAKGLTEGVFQLESEGMTKTVIDMYKDIDSLTDAQVTEQCFERLIAIVALYRPGPMDSIPDFIEGMLNPSKIHYAHDSLKPILSRTYGIIVYQEQVIEIVKALAGFSGGQADDVRKAMGKKIAEKMAKAKEIFLHGNKAEVDANSSIHYAQGCVANGISEDVALLIWEKMEKFAEYAFNRSHAACYAWISYLTAYMACHWKDHFFAAMCTTYKNDADKLKGYLSAANARGIGLLSPSVNTSGVGFRSQDGSIVYSLQGISSVNAIAPLIVEERKNGEYKDVIDFYNRIITAGGKCPKGVFESLAYAGALDGFGYNRKELIENFPVIAEEGKNFAAQSMMGQFNMFGEEDVIELTRHPDYTHRQKLDFEYKVLGAYVSGHPIDEAASIIDPKKHTIIDNFSEIDNKKNVSVVGQIKKLQTRFTKNGDKMCNFLLQGRYHTIRCVVFPKDFENLLIREESIVSVVGDFKIDEDFGNQIIVRSVSTDFEKPKAEEIVVTVDGKESKARLDGILDTAEKGDVAIFVRYSVGGKEYPTKYRIKKSLSVVTSLANWQFLTRVC